MNEADAFAVRGKIDQGSPLELPELGNEHVRCPCCKEDDGAFWASEDGYTAVKCGGCGFVYVNPRPSDDAITQANIVGEHRTESGHLKVVFRRSEAKIRHYRLIVSGMLPGVTTGGPISWLDVGAGFGEFLESLQSIVPDESRLDGLELMVPKIQVAQERGLNVTDTHLTEITHRYDVVSLINVFSHIPDIDAFLGLIKGVMKPGGILFIETGNGADLDNRGQYPDRLYLPDHLIFGGLATVERILERNGFKLVATKTLRRDTFVFCLKMLVKRLLGHPMPLRMPYRSPFRTIFFHAQWVE